MNKSNQDKINNKLEYAGEYNIELIKFSANNYWKFDLPTNTCGICKNDLERKCTKCNESSDCLIKQCKISKGKCGHGFHNCCISSNLLKRNKCCPNDGQLWSYDILDMDNDNKLKCD